MTHEGIEVKKEKYRQHVYDYNFEHSQTYARAYFERELEYADKIFAKKIANGEDISNFTELDYVKKLIKRIAEQLDLYGYDIFKLRFNDND